jgi:hypothetical protein
MSDSSGIQIPSADGPFSLIQSLYEEYVQSNPNPAHTIAGDKGRVRGLVSGLFSADTPLEMGVVTHAMPGTDWYRVKLGRTGAAISCCVLKQSSTMPLGVRDAGSAIPALSTVLVWQPPGLKWAIIMGAVPDKVVDGETICPGWIGQGGQAGFKRELIHKLPIQRLFDGGGILDFNGGQPIDATPLDWGKFSETGVGLFVDSFQTFIRVNEACGLFLNWFDSHTRLSGINMDIMSSCHEICVREDEGEARYMEGCATYLHESLGLYQKGIDPFEEQDPKEVQYEKARGFIDLPEGEEDMQPVYRYQEFGGYLGQGRLRMVMAPKPEGVKQQYKDEAKHYGLWVESIGLDGSYTNRSAKSVYIAKRVLIPVPKEKKLPEDQKDGDSAEKSNYKFAGMFGGGEEHKVGDVKVEDEPKHMLRVAGTFDLLAYNYNWKALHPFVYHKEDYYVPEESDLETLEKATDELDFSTLKQKDFMRYPEPKQIKIDDRYNQVDYFQRESYIALHEDGSIAIGDGYGAQIVMAGGQIRIEAPGDIQLLSGKRVVSMAWDIILKAKNSLDGSAAKKDVRFKAERNMQLLAGNDKSQGGGILLESKSQKDMQLYDGKVGEDVISSGIVMRAPKSHVAALSKEIYLRTGGEGPLEDGNITIDASQGKKPVNVYGKELNAFVQKAVNFWLPPQGAEEKDMKKSFYFGKSSCILGVKATVLGGLLVTPGVFVCGKGIFTSGSIGSCKSIASKQGGMLGKIDPDACGEIDESVAKAKKNMEDHVKAGKKVFKGTYVQKYYKQPTQLGNKILLQKLSFSFRDPKSPGKQYKTQEIKFPETRWQQMARLGMADDGGTAFEEMPVEYQGDETMPWPGKKKWEDGEVFHKLKEHKLFDASNGRSKDRGEDGGPYTEDPKVEDWEKSSMKDDFKIILE